jgi:type I restriction enzyme M protein
LFYNTGINTYIWFLTNKKAKERRGKVQLINANASKVTGVNAKGKEETAHIFARSNKKSLGNKRNELTQEHINELTEIYTNFEENDYCKIYNNDDFGFYQLTIEQPEYDAKGKIKMAKGNPKSDSKKRDKENVPLTEDIETYFTKEVLPHVPEAWIDYDKTRIGYEINFTKYFYEYEGLQPAADIKADIIGLEKEIATLLNDLLV